MITNILKQKCIILVKQSTQDALGETIEWEEVGEYWTRKVSIDVVTKTAYMQNNTVVTDKFIFDGELDLQLGKHQIQYDDETYDLAESSQFIEEITTVLTRKL
jgi:hypothetical protein